LTLNGGNVVLQDWQVTGGARNGRLASRIGLIATSLRRRVLARLVVGLHLVLQRVLDADIGFAFENMGIIIPSFFSNWKQNNQSNEAVRAIELAKDQSQATRHRLFFLAKTGSC